MKTKRDNRIILDLNKCQWARYYWRNQHGQVVSLHPNEYTVNNEKIDADAPALFHPNYPDETCLIRATRLGLLDIWIPEVFFKVAANAGVIYTGAKATAMYKAWCEKIFNKRK